MYSWIMRESYLTYFQKFIFLLRFDLLEIIPRLKIIVCILLNCDDILI